jgi:hypothetical protein
VKITARSTVEVDLVRLKVVQDIIELTHGNVERFGECIDVAPTGTAPQDNANEHRYDDADRGRAVEWLYEVVLTEERERRE